ncbi:hypothetical protein [Maribacter algarum]|uniref:hypothetical protein n=1 Tax=Maribacter algarum (ex Zhang et al. 2020) TaxID=2578118 RepID=UPI001485CFDA|nr:hypothetical protein [Maribacter algarum]
MKKVASILAVAVFAVSMIATQAEKIDLDFDLATMLTCADCPDEDPRGGTA